MVTAKVLPCCSVRLGWLVQPIPAGVLFRPMQRISNRHARRAVGSPELNVPGENDGSGAKRGALRQERNDLGDRKDEITSTQRRGEVSLILSFRLLVVGNIPEVALLYDFTI